MQCVVDAQPVIRNIVPGYHLYVSTKTVSEAPEWPKGWYGLLRQNDPEFIFCVDVKDFKLPGTNLDDVYDSFYTTPMRGYDFVRACKKAGYNPKKHGYHIYVWFIEHMIKQFKKNKLMLLVQHGIVV